MVNTYDMGDVVKVSGTFSNSGGTAVDPGTIQFKYRNPSSGSVTTLVYGTGTALAKSATGIYYVNVNLAASGKWHYRMEGTGDNAAAAEDYMIARASYF